MSSSSSASAVIVKGGRGLSCPAYDGSHRLHVCGSGDGKIYLEEENTLVEIGDTGGNPTSICFDHLNSLFVCDAAHCAVLLLKEDGSPQTIVQEYEGKALKVGVREREKGKKKKAWESRRRRRQRNRGAPRVG